MPQSSLRRADRVSAILDRVASHGSVDAGHLADEFRVSPATIRRDLQVLEDQRLLSRTHGGAVAVDVAYELPVRYRVGQTRGHSVVVGTQLQPEDSGILAITSSRAAYLGSHKTAPK